MLFPQLGNCQVFAQDPGCQGQPRACPRRWESVIRRELFSIKPTSSVMETATVNPACVGHAARELERVRLTRLWQVQRTFGPLHMSEAE